MKRRIAAFFLSFCFCVSGMTAIAYAEEEENGQSETIEETAESDAEEQITEAEKESAEPVQQDREEEISEEAEDTEKSADADDINVMDESTQDEAEDSDSEIETAEEVKEEAENYLAGSTSVSSFEYSVSNSEVTITKFVGDETTVVIPSSINGMTVTKIGDRAFSNCTSLTSVSIPETVKTIGDNAFLFCTKLEKANLPEKITSISQAVFAYCQNLKSINIPDTVTEIGNGAFQRSGLTSITIGGKCVKIGENAFLKCSDLKDVVISENVSSIEKQAFANCTSLSSISIPLSLKTISTDAFVNCPDHMKVTYNGRKTQWNSITIESGNDPLENADITYLGDIAVEKITLSPANISLDIGRTQTVKATITPADAVDKTLTWKSSDSAVASVNQSGNITAIAAGTAVITAKSSNGKTATCTVTVRSNSGTENGFVTKNGKTYYYKNGTKLTGLQTIDGKIYYFNASGEMQTGWQKVNGKKYYFKTNGAAELGWKQWEGVWYYLNKPNGYAMTGLMTLDGKIYAFDSSGKQLLGWQTVDGKKYFFKSGGAAEKGWKQVGSSWYFLDRTTAVMATGIKTIDGKIYGFNSSGVMLKGWQKINGSWYFFKSNGAAEKGWKVWNDAWYFLDRTTAVMSTGIKTIDGKIYGFNSSGVMLKGWQKIAGSGYFFKSNGAAEKGWKKWNGNWYFLDRTTAVMATGVKTVDGKIEYFRSTGEWIEIGTTETFKNYYEVIRAAQIEYGIGAKNSNGRYIGLYYAELVDFNCDGNEELVIGVTTADTLDVYVFGSISGTIKLLYHPDNYDASEGGAPNHVEYATIGPDGKVYLRSLGGQTTVENGKYVFYVSIYYYGFYNNKFQKVCEKIINRETHEVTYKGPLKLDLYNGASYYPYTEWGSCDLNGNQVNVLAVTYNTIEKCKSMAN